MKKRTWKPALFLLFLSCAALRGQTQDAGGIASVAVSANYGRSWGFKLEQEFRFNQNYSTYHRAATSLKASYSILPKRLKAEGEYVFIHQNVTTNYELRHRGSLGLSTKIELRPFDLTITSKMQSTWRDNSTGDYKFNPKYVWRNKIDCTYNIFGSPFKPYVSGEIFYPINTSQGAAIEGIRGTIGGEYRIDRRNSIELFYRVDKETQKPNPLTIYYTGLGWLYRL